MDRQTKKVVDTVEHVCIIIALAAGTVFLSTFLTTLLLALVR